MKKILSAFVALAICTFSFGQQTDTTAPFKKNNNIPAFKILQGDSTWYTNAELPKNKPTVIIYFSPDCSHCQLTAKEFADRMDKLKDITLIWTSYHTPKEIKDFAKAYQLDHYPNVKFGRDPAYALPVFFRVKFTPFMAIYNSKGKLVKTYDQGTDPDTILSVLANTKS